LIESVFHACILEAAAAGTTVLLSSHILAEVERLCDRVTIIRDRRAVQQYANLVDGNAALMSIFPTVRHTRTEEESERIEVIRSAPIGRHAPLAATMVHVGIANLVVAATTACFITLERLPIRGSVAFSSTVLGAGCLFAAVALVVAQIIGTSRGALGVSSAVLALSFVLRAVGDVIFGALSWLSQIG
jgi:ABC-2 type transport system permease protein